MATTIRIGRHTYRVDADGYSPDLHAYVVRDKDTGRLVTIPIN